MKSTLPTPGRGDEPQRTERVLRWYRLRLGALIAKVSKADSETLRALLDWFAERPEEFLVWQPWEEYHGSGYSLGRWTLDFEAFKQAWPRAKTGVHRALMPPAVPPGPIDVEAALVALSAPTASASTEPGAYDLLRAGRPWSPAYDRLLQAQRRIRRKTPRPCHCCGGLFVGRSVAAITCETCKAAGQRRCTACREVFRSVGRGPRKCEKCRAESLAAQRQLRLRK